MRRLLSAAPAVAMLAIGPIAHADTSTHLVPMCSADGPRLLLLPGAPAPPAKQREERQASLCAHATCPREFRLERRPRARP